MTRKRTLSVDWVSDLGDLERDMAKAQRTIKTAQRDLERLTGGQQK